MPPAEGVCAVHETFKEHLQERQNKNTEEHTVLFAKFDILDNKFDKVSTKVAVIMGIGIALNILIMAAAQYFSGR
jgi:hypothetical protein